MNILRLPPYSEIFAEYDVPGDDTYTLIIKKYDRDETILEQPYVASFGEYKLEIPWKPMGVDESGASVAVFDFSQYDETYYLEILDSSGETIIQDTLTVERPYVNPLSLVTADYTISQAKKDELVARSIIDSITGGFYFKTNWMEVTGEGTDYMPLWERTYKILKVFENAELVFDSSLEVPELGDWGYMITKDKSAITKSVVGYEGAYNRSESNQNPLFIAVSDSIGIFETDDSFNTFTFKPGVSFPSRWDYLFFLEGGYKVVPSDIKEATLMLMEDLKCGKLDYYKRYVTSYSTDQFRIQMDKSVIDGTGNILVDKIINKYINNVKKLRML